MISCVFFPWQGHVHTDMAYLKFFILSFPENLSYIENLCLIFTLSRSPSPPVVAPPAKRARGGPGGPSTSTARPAQRAQGKKGGGRRSSGKSPGQAGRGRRYRPGPRALMEIRLVHYYRTSHISSLTLPLLASGNFKNLQICSFRSCRFRELSEKSVTR